MAGLLPSASRTVATSPPPAKPNFAPHTQRHNHEHINKHNEDYIDLELLLKDHGKP